MVDLLRCTGRGHPRCIYSALMWAVTTVMSIVLITSLAVNFFCILQLQEQLPRSEFCRCAKSSRRWPVHLRFWSRCLRENEHSVHFVVNSLFCFLPDDFDQQIPVLDTTSTRPWPTLWTTGGKQTFTESVSSLCQPAIIQCKSHFV